MLSLRETRLMLRRADAARAAAFDSADFDSATYAEIAAQLRRARADHKAALVAARREV